MSSWLLTHFCPSLESLYSPSVWFRRSYCHWTLTPFLTFVPPSQAVAARDGVFCFLTIEPTFNRRLEVAFLHL